MKHLLSYLFSVLLLGSTFIGCSDQQTPTDGNDEALTALNKPVIESYWWNMDWDPVYEDCATGEDMQNHGWLKIYTREITTPSGNVIISGWVDYDAYEGVTLENLATGDIWTLTTGHNPFHEVIKENGMYILRYNWNELYKKQNSPNIHIHLKGHLKILPDGTVTHDRESYTCF